MAVDDRLNIGCGSRIRSGWVNIDFASTDPNVIRHDLLTSLPFADGQFSFVYGSHVLEHFTKADAVRVLNECQRILVPGGVIRCVVPDLERLARNYLEQLAAARGGDGQACTNREWAVLALIDQCSRDCPGGEMLPFLQANDAASLEWVFQTEGSEIRANHEALHRSASVGGAADARASTTPYFLRRLRPSRNNLSKLARAFARWTDLLPPSTRTALAIGRFRIGGEVHRWMYDSYSLRRMLEAIGFVSVVQRTAFDSYLPDWSAQHLDTEPDGTIYKPTSLFMEARKP